MCVRGPWRPEAAIRSLGVGVTVVVRHPTQWWELKPRSSRRGGEEFLMAEPSLQPRL